MNMSSSITSPSGRQGFYIDIMEGGRFLCQLHYTRRGFPVVVDGRTCESHDLRDIEEFVYENRPSLRNRKIHIAFSNNRV